MQFLTIRKAISLVVLLSLISQSCVPVSLSVVNPILAVANSQDYPKVEPSNYQPPVFEHPEPRIGLRTDLEGLDSTPSLGGNHSESAVQIPSPIPSAIPATTPTPNPQDISTLNSDTAEISSNSVDQYTYEWQKNGYASSNAGLNAITLSLDNFSIFYRSSAWANQKIDLAQNFDLSFSVYLGNRAYQQLGADGIAFVLQNQGITALGPSGAGLGYQGITPSIAVEIDTYRNTNFNDPPPSDSAYNDNHVALLKNGNMNHNGSLPLFQAPTPYEDGQEHTFRSVWNASTKTLIVYIDSQELFRYTEDIVQTVFGGNSQVWYGFTGGTATGTNLQYFRVISAVASDATNSPSNLDSEISCIAICTQEYEGGPINTRNGAYEYSTTDIAITTAAGPISFERFYSSTLASTTRYLGYGWTHNQDMHLEFGPTSGGVTVITLKGPSANSYRFKQGVGTIWSEDGVYASLAYDSIAQKYQLTDKQHNIYEFDADNGTLLSYTARDINRKILYTYDTRGRLIKISDDSGGNYLTLTYTKGNTTNISKITDHTGRQVTYSYQDGNNNLTQVTDVLGRNWMYQYDSSHHLTRVTDPAGIIVERTEYDTNGRAIRQFNGASQLQVELIYNTDGSTTILDGEGNVRTDSYDSLNTVISQTDGTGAEVTKSYDFNHRPVTIEDAVGNTSLLDWSVDGAGLTQILADGTNTYLYGLGRVAERQGTANEYYLGDALGSVRQITNDAGTITLARNYEPYGKTAQTIGTAQTDFGFTGEFTDASGLVYLRARYYESVTGRFTTRDTFEGDVNTPASLNRFNYAHSNPVMNTDPSGHCIFAGVDTVLCAAIGGAVAGGVIGGAYAKWMYHLAYTGKCGCEGQQLISQYTEAQFVWKGIGMGAVFGAAFSALTVASAGGAVVAALAGVGLSGYGIANSIQRIQANPNNECAWWDLGLSIFGLAASGYALGTAVRRIGLPGGAPAPQISPVGGRPPTKNAFPQYGEGFGSKKVVGEWVNTENLYPIHPADAVLPGEGMTHAQWMAETIAREGFDLRFSIPVKKVENGTFILQGGHHRLEALRLLGYTEIPVIYDPVEPVWSVAAARIFLGGTENPTGLNRFPLR